MIYFVQNRATGAIKGRYSQNPEKAFAALQAKTSDKLDFLGAIQGSQSDLTRINRQFSPYQQGARSTAAILGSIRAMIASDAANPKPKMNVIVAGDSEPYFVWSSDQHRMAYRSRLQVATSQTLSEVHAKTPMATILTCGERLLEHLVWEWARQNRVEVDPRAPNWGRFRNGAASEAYKKMLRSRVDHKMLLVFISDNVSSTTTAIIRQAEKLGIEVVRKTVVSPQLRS